MSKKFVVTIISIAVLCAAVYFLGLMFSKQHLVRSGVVDEKGKIVVPIKYDMVNYIDANDFFVINEGKNFIYNKETKKLTSTEYRSIRKISDNFYLVSNDNKSGLVDKNYKVVVPIKYWFILVYKDLIQAYNHGHCYLFDLNGKKISEINKDNVDAHSFIFNVSPKDKNKVYYVIDKKGNKLDVSNYQEVHGLSEDSIAFKKDDKWGVINMSGKEIVPPIYGYISRFKNGYAVVSDRDMRKSGEIEKAKHGVIDKNGKVIIPISNNYIGDFSEGLFPIRNDHKAGYIDTNGKEVIPLKYTYTIPFSEGLAAVRNDESKLGFIDKTGKQIVPFIYEDTDSFQNGYAIVEKRENIFTDILMSSLASFDSDYNYSSEEYGVIDKTGKEVIPCKYKMIYSDAEIFHMFDDYMPKDNYFIVEKTNKLVLLSRVLGLNKVED